MSQSAAAAARKASIEKLLFSAAGDGAEQSDGTVSDGARAAGGGDPRFRAAGGGPAPQRTPGREGGRSRGREGSVEREARRQSRYDRRRRQRDRSLSRGKSVEPEKRKESIRRASEALAQDQACLERNATRRASVAVECCPPDAAAAPAAAAESPRRRTAETDAAAGTAAGAGAGGAGGAGAAAAAPAPAPLPATPGAPVSVVLVGASRSGKTLFAQTFAAGVAALRPPPTLGVERHDCGMPPELAGNARLPELRVWDTSGDARFDPRGIPPLVLGYPKNSLPLVASNSRKHGLLGSADSSGSP
jgi:hypothetical protein